MQSHRHCIDIATSSSILHIMALQTVCMQHNRKTVNSYLVGMIEPAAWWCLITGEIRDSACPMMVRFLVGIPNLAFSFISM